MQLIEPSQPAPPPAVSLVRPATGERSYYSITEAAQVIGVSRVSIWRWIRDGRLPVLRLGERTTRIRRQDVDRLLSAHGKTDGTTRLRVAVGRRDATVESADATAPQADWRVLGVGAAASAHMVQF